MINNIDLYRQIAGIPMGTNCAPMTCFYFTVKEILWPLFPIIKRLHFFTQITLHLDI